MTHFSYTGNVTMNAANPSLSQIVSQNLESEDVEVLAVEFLTPAKVRMKVGDKEINVMVSVDIINRKVYDSKGQLLLSNKIFSYLDEVNSLPEDFFRAPDDVSNEASDAELDHWKIKQNLGDNYE